LPVNPPICVVDRAPNSLEVRPLSPMMIEHVDLIVELRRHQTLELGAVPPEASEALMNLRATDSAIGAAPMARLDWAADLNLPVLKQRR
jgi:hypothetical protein